MDASLTCAVCLGLFREPVTLPTCSHNFCKSCLLKCAAPHLWTPTEPRSCTVSCPLCRKVSTLSRGLAALPVNTTLAEVVRLLLPSGGAKDARPGSPDCGKRRCEEHPDYRLELFCRNCERACCGRCVSLRHQGVFHSVNLLDVTFQEEKLLFFNSLKTLREINEQLVKEISDNGSNTESILKANKDAVTSAIGEAQKALDLKKQELLDMLHQQQIISKKRNEIRKATKKLHKTTVESLLKDCVKIADEYEPSSFLQAACGLNKRMKSNLELQEFCADHNDVLQIEPQCLDIQAVLDAVSTLKMTTGSKDVSKLNGSFSFKSISRTWSRGMETNENYCDQELTYLQGEMEKNPMRFVSITKMPEYQHLSYEELRLKYYEPSVVQDRKAVAAPEIQMPSVCNNVNGFTFKMSLTNCAKSTRLKTQDSFDREHTACGKDVFEEKPTKMDVGRLKQKDNLSACALDKDDDPEEMSVNFAASEEFYDASCNLDPDVEEPGVHRNGHQLQRR
ncbi:hypothetical protein GDO78_011787 [Eleutherodactylus coqui]|uniref:Uncharacterized protein n=1 Tax=Eleutherodactylus coqui TaxID=57060 RepID=A0A8J6K3W4_ELECQ|nr:hypothetical protein GDO78_011787 [Eleutherodactylus coqui]